MAVVSRAEHPEPSAGHPRIRRSLPLAKRLRARVGPLLILAPPRSFTSVIGSMVGQHPQMYALPETKLMAFETMQEWWQACSPDTWPWRRNNGLLRVIAELFFGKQSERNAHRATGWLRRRLHLTTGAVMEAIADRLYPLIPVDKSPVVVRSVESMRCAYAMFPRARFVHLLRHPRAQGESAMKYDSYVNEDRASPGRQATKGTRRQIRWNALRKTIPRRPAEAGEETERPPKLFDPQWAWYAIHRNILEFLSGVPADQVFRVRGEDILTDPDSALRPLVSWLGLRDDDQAMEDMKHPERSPYACLGPRGARGGNDLLFMKSPELRLLRSEPKSLDGPVSWQTDGSGFALTVRRLAEELGYT